MSVDNQTAIAVAQMNDNLERLIEKYDDSFTRLANEGDLIKQELQAMIDGGRVAEANNALMLEGKNTQELINSISMSYIYKGQWDGDYAGSTAWNELNNISVVAGNYMVFLDAHSRNAIQNDYTDPDGGQFGVFVDDVTIPDQIGDEAVIGNFSNIADLSETDAGYGGSRNNATQIVFINIPQDTIMRFKGRTPDGDAGGINMRMKTVVYKIGV